MLFAAENRKAFFQGGAQGFGTVGAASAQQPSGQFGLQLRGQAALGAVTDQGLGLGEGKGRAVGQACGECVGMGVHVIIRDHFTDQARSQGSVGAP